MHFIGYQQWSYCMMCQPSFVYEELLAVTRFYLYVEMLCNANIGIYVVAWMIRRMGKNNSIHICNYKGDHQWPSDVLTKAGCLMITHFESLMIYRKTNASAVQNECLLYHHQDWQKRLLNSFHVRTGTYPEYLAKVGQMQLYYIVTSNYGLKRNRYNCFNV